MGFMRLMVLAGMLASGAATQALAQSTIAGTTAAGAATGTTGHYFGQSFVAGTTGTNYNTISFQYLTSAGANTGNETGNLYLFSSPYTGTATQLSGATGNANYVGTGGANAGAFTFSPAVTLTGGNMYYAYNDTPTSNTANTVTGGSNVVTGGYSYSTGGAFQSSTIDLNFRVNGVAAATPEPAAWSMMILGFGIVGGALRRQKRRVLATA